MSIIYEFQNNDLIECVLLKRPSEYNRSPYVADVLIKQENRNAIAHVPSLHLGNKCISGAECIMKFARKKNKNKDRVGRYEVSSKYGTPKCELHSCLVKHNNVWIAAHPKIGEDIANNILKEGTVYLPIHSSEIIKSQREVSKVANTDMRSDFLLTHRDGSYTLVEVKTVVDSDKDECVNYVGDKVAVFPWGKKNQKYKNEKVVSARAIKHIDELTDISRGIKKDDRYEILRTCVLFIIVRGDCQSFRARDETCPIFARYLKNAHENGVNIIAHRVSWEKVDENMVGIDNGNIPVIF